MPYELLTKIEEASLAGDTDSVERLTETIRSHDSVLADAMAVLTADFDHEKILELIQKGRNIRK